MTTEIQHPGVFLLDRYLRPLEITPSCLAEALGVGARRISELVKGRRAITPDMAARLAVFFDVPARWWLELQARYDADRLARTEEVRDVVKPYQRLAEILVTPQGITHLSAPETCKPEPPRATFSDDFLRRLREQAKWADVSPRVVSETTFADGTVALVGK